MGLLLFPFQTTLAHCDTENGPVITAAREALQTNNVKLVLIWVKKQDEAIIKEAFQKTVNLRKISQEVQRVVDNYFFETLVRIHRAGEGVAYTGIKDSGKVDIPIAAADDAIEKNSLADVMKLLHEAINKGVSEKFNDAISKRSYDKNNVDAGREYVESYVLFMHYVEAIYAAAGQPEAGHHQNDTTDTKHENKSSPTSEIKNEAQPDHLTHILIIGGTLLIIIVQIILSIKNQSIKFHERNRNIKGISAS